MKRDLDLLRALLMEIEKLGLEERLEAREIVLPPWRSDEIVYHCRYLMQAGYIEAIDTSSSSGPNIFVRYLLPAGHDYLDVVRSETVWSGVKSRLRDQGISGTLDVVESIAKALIMRAVGLG